ncbi:hypothetical protein BGX31_005372 [Mortierella sp. GBA43]|nr:hypothetical protein BGX31_005372 [Mortierella sp. GBA43]
MYDHEKPKSAKGTPISVPKPFIFDNHTVESSTETGDVPQEQQPKAPNKSPPDTDPVASKANSTLTILRIKRKRNEEPLDTLVVQENETSTTKKQKKLENDPQRNNAIKPADNTGAKKPTAAVFRLATTVNTESFKDPTHSIRLREKIAHLTEAPRPRSRLSDRHAPEFEDRVQQRREQLVQGKNEEARTARYRVINQNRTGLNSKEQCPPQVKSSVEAEAEAILDVFKMYDAVKEDEPQVKEYHLPNPEEPDIMCNFLPMVREYLSISDKTPDPVIIEPSAERSSDATDSKRDNTSDEDEYVYDIYYCDPHADHYQESRHRAIGSLLWFSDNEDDFMHSDSSDYADDDSDSNAEDYYRNDYPEDELSHDEYQYELSDTDDEYVY